MIRTLFWRIIALFFVVVAFIGVIVPGLPTTEFLLLAVWASANGWPRLHNWLLKHPRFGPLIEQWQTHRIIPRRAKWIAFISMFISTVFLVSSAAPLLVKCTAPLIMAIVLIWLICRPERPQTPLM